MGIIELLGGVFSLAVLILKEFFSWRREKRKEQEEFEKEEDLFFRFASDALARMRAQRKNDSERARRMEDERGSSSPPGA